ncbi:MAG: MgtC/SapB family protein [Candidatus Eisenbacteria bacterium]
MTPDQLAVLKRLLLALLLGGSLGIERGLQRKSAGARTHMMVALGSALLTLLSIRLPALLARGDVDPGRIAAQIVTGVGFLGAGSILHSGGSVRGLTTAASIWLASAIGMASGAGFYSGAILATLLGLFVLLAEHLHERFGPRGGSEPPTERGDL